MTKKAMFSELLKVVVSAEVSADMKTELIEGINHELELLEKKASSPKKPSAIQVANEGLKLKLKLEVLSEVPKTVSDILKELEDDSLTNQRITHLLTAMVTEGTAKREVVKRKAYYTANIEA